MLVQRNPQLNKQGELIHLLSIEGLPRPVLHHILDTAGTFLSVNDRDVKKVPLLRGKSVFNLFFENSTRTRTTFEIGRARECCAPPLPRARNQSTRFEEVTDASGPSAEAGRRDECRSPGSGEGRWSPSRR